MNMFNATIILEPSFHLKHKWRIAINNNGGEISGKCRSASAIGKLSELQFQLFLQSLVSLPYTPPSEEYDVFDGIAVMYLINREGQEITTQITSPNMDTSPDFSLLARWVWECLYGLNADYDMYLEQIYGYFGWWGVPLLRNGNRLKIFGSLSVSSDNYKAIEQQLDELAKEPNASVDMTNFAGMGTLFLPLFKNFAAANPNIRWDANKTAARDLELIGVPYFLSAERLCCQNDEKYFEIESSIGEANIYLTYGSDSQAIELLEAALKDDPDNQEAKSLLEMAYELQNK